MAGKFNPLSKLAPYIFILLARCTAFGDRQPHRRGDRRSRSPTTNTWLDVGGSGHISRRLLTGQGDSWGSFSGIRPICPGNYPPIALIAWLALRPPNISAQHCQILTAFKYFIDCCPIISIYFAFTGRHVYKKVGVVLGCTKRDPIAVLQRAQFL